MEPVVCTSRRIAIISLYFLQQIIYSLQCVWGLSFCRRRRIKSVSNDRVYFTTVMLRCLVKELNSNFHFVIQGSPAVCPFSVVQTDPFVWNLNTGLQVMHMILSKNEGLICLRDNSKSIPARPVVAQATVLPAIDTRILHAIKFNTQQKETLQHKVH